MREDVLTSRKNPLIQQVRKLQSSRSYRYAAGRFTGDGTKLLEEAVRWCGGLETVLLREDVEAELPPAVRVIRISPELMDYASGMEAPQGALFVCRMPEWKETPLLPGTLILDGIQDPGNLGTMLRTADAMGAPLAVMTDGCADPWNPKTVRASMGAVFRLPLRQRTAAEVIGDCRQADLRLLASALSPQAVPLESVDLRRAAMIVGSEGGGIRQALLAAADEHVIIPIRDRCESLNAAAAAAILLWQMRRAGAFESD